MAKPFVRVTGARRCARRSFDDAKAEFKHGLPHAGLLERRGTLVIGFQAVSRERWEKAFGPFDPDKLRRAKALQDRQRSESRIQNPESRGAAVHGDNKGTGRRLFKAWTFDWGLGERIRSRTHRRELMKRAGLVEAR